MVKERTRPAHLNDYVLYTICCDKDPLPLSPASIPTTSSPQGKVCYLISHYVTCDNFLDSQQAFLAAVTADYEPKSYLEAMKHERWRNAMT